MNSKNICKFSASPFSELLSVTCFIYELSQGNLVTGTPLARHRVYLFTQGKGRITVDGTAYAIGTGTLFFTFAQESVSAVEGEKLHCLYIDFDGPRAFDLLRRFLIRAQNRCFDGFGALIPFWRESLTRASESALDLAAESVLLYTLSRMSVERSREGGVVSDILRLTAERFSDPTLSIANLSEELSYHPKYISHLFKKEMGITYSEYLRDTRLNYARGLFDHGLDSVKNVALLSGFSDPLYFSSVFKKVVGLSPTDYIKAQQTDDSN